MFDWIFVYGNSLVFSCNSNYDSLLMDRSFAEGVIIELFTFCSPDSNFLCSPFGPLASLCVLNCSIVIRRRAVVIAWSLAHVWVLDFCFQLQRA